MIDEKTHGGMIVLRHGNQGNRMGDSMPDYDNVKVSSIFNSNYGMRSGKFPKNA